MRNFTFGSILAPRIHDVLRLREALGYQDENIRKGLSMFDRYVRTRGWSQARLTRELVDAWLATLGTIHPYTRAMRLHAVRVLARYLADSDPASYVPGPPWTGRIEKTFRPYIYTPDEVKLIVATVEKARTKRLAPRATLRPRVYATLFSLLYSTGMRVSEALALRLEDVDLTEGCIVVRETKFHKSRALPLRDDVTEGLRCHREERDAAGHDTSPEAPFFLNPRRQPYTRTTVWLAFRDAVRTSGIRGTRTKAHGPRLHDLRHSYAVHRLQEWYRDGGDVQARLPLLSTYMGHVSIVSTQVYLDITAELLHEAAQRFKPPFLHAQEKAGSSCQ